MGTYPVVLNEVWAFFWLSHQQINTKVPLALAEGTVRRCGPGWDPVDGGPYQYWLPMGKLFHLPVLPLQSRDADTCLL